MTGKTRQLGREIRYHRRKAGISQTELGRLVQAANQTVSGYETGRSTPDRDTIERIDSALSAGGALVQGWEQATDEREIPEKWKKLEGVEKGATEIREFHNSIVPGLLQCESYAKAILRNTNKGLFDEAKLKKLVESRIARFSTVSEAELSFVLDEQAVRRVVGSREIQAEQVERLISLAKSRRILLGVIPLYAPFHPCPSGPFRIMHISGNRIVAHEEYHSGDNVVTGSDVNRLVSMFGSLQAESLPTSQTIELLEKIKDELSQ